MLLLLIFFNQSTNQKNRLIKIDVPLFFYKNVYFETYYLTIMKCCEFYIQMWNWSIYKINIVLLFMSYNCFKNRTQSTYHDSITYQDLSRIIKPYHTFVGIEAWNSANSYKSMPTGYSHGIDPRMAYGSFVTFIWILL